jgi:hypothetical protein
MVDNFQDKDNGYSLYNDLTQTGASDDTAPMPAAGSYYPTNWYAQPSSPLLLSGSEQQNYRKKSFSQILRQKLNQLLNLALLVVILLLAARFLLIFFKVTTSIFTQWVYTASRPLVMPFINLVPLTNYNGYRVDGTILIAIVFYVVVRLLFILILRLFLLF